MKILVINWKEQNFPYSKHEHDITSHIVIHENGCVCGIKHTNNKLQLIDVMSNEEINIYFTKYKQTLIELDNYNYSPKDYIEFYLLEPNWKNQICEFLKTTKIFTIKQFGSMLKFNPSDYKESWQIAQNILYQILLPKEFAAHYQNIFQVTEQGRTWAIEQLEPIKKQIAKETKKMIEHAESITYEDHIETEWGKFKSKPIKEVYETIKKYPESILQGFSILAFHYDRKDDVKDFLVRLNKPNLSPNMFRKALLDYQEVRREAKEQELEESLIRRKPVPKTSGTSIPSRTSTPSKTIVPAHINNKKNDNTNNIPLEENPIDPDIIVANEYLTWLQVDIEAKIFGNQNDLLDIDKIKELHVGVKKNRQNLNMNHPANFTYCMAVLSAYGKLNKTNIKSYIKVHKHNDGIYSEINKRSKEIQLIIDKK